MARNGHVSRPHRLRRSSAVAGTVPRAPSTLMIRSPQDVTLPRRRSAVVILLLLTALATLATTRSAAVQAGDTVLGITQPDWVVGLPAAACATGSTNTNCHFSSPAIADIDGDGLRDVVAATNNGHIVVVRHDGTVLWNVDTSPAFDMAPHTQIIRSSPSIADLDGDGHVEIVVGTGSTTNTTCVKGGVIVLSHTGAVMPGWPQLGDDVGGAGGCPDGFASTPALGDLDNDGDREIVVGGFDKTLRAWHHDGTSLPGFPIDSYHYQFKGWANLQGRLADTIWASPALADIDGDGYLDIVINTDEGNYASYGDWECPYQLPPGWPSGYCGGSTYVVNRFGELLPGFPRFVHETMQSSPAVTDLDGDGSAEIITGTGTFYYRNSPDQPLDGARVFVYTSSGADAPGWAGGKSVNAPTPSSPAVGDIDGDGDPEVVIATLTGKLYAWHHGGAPVAGFPVQPVSHFGTYVGSHDVGEAVILADSDGDGAMEILLKLGWGIVIIDGSGAQLTSRTFPGNTLPIYTTNGSIINTPAIGDLDNDGQLEVVAMNSELTVWQLGDSTPRTSWPMFRQTADRSGAAGVLAPQLALTIDELTLLHDVDWVTAPVLSFTMSVRGGDFNWQISAPDAVTVTPAAGAATQPDVDLALTVDATGLPIGQHALGDLVFAVEVVPEIGDSAVLPQTVPLTVIVGDLFAAHLPLATGP